MEGISSIPPGWYLSCEVGKNFEEKWRKAEDYKDIEIWKHNEI